MATGLKVDLVDDVLSDPLALCKPPVDISRRHAPRFPFDVPRGVRVLCNLGRRGAHHAHCAQHVEDVGVAQDGSQWSEGMESDVALID